MVMKCWGDGVMGWCGGVMERDQRSRGASNLVLGSSICSTCEVYTSMFLRHTFVVLFMFALFEGCSIHN